MAIPVEKLKAFAGSSVPGMGPAPQEVVPSTTEPGAAGGVDRFAALRPLLEQNAEPIEDMIADLDTEVLASMAAGLADETPPELLMQVRSQVETLDQGFQDELKRASAGGMSEEEAASLADHLLSESLLSGDPGQFAGWLLVAADAVAEVDDTPMGDEMDGADTDAVAPVLDDTSGLA